MYTLGIDLGTTTVKCTIINDQKGIIGTHQVRHDADIIYEDPSCQLFHEQNPRKIFQSLDLCLENLHAHLNKVGRISVTGQMHGVIVWAEKINEPSNLNANISSMIDNLTSYISNLITWQDERCDKNFLQTLPTSPSNNNLHTGYGFATLAWMIRNGYRSSDYDLCGSIMDFLVWLIARRDYVYTTPQVANSWGYFDIERTSWETKQLKEAGILSKIKLPSVCSETFSRPAKDLCGFPSDTRVFSSLGDMQCSIAAVQPSTNEAVLNIGTSTQLSFIVSKYELKTSRQDNLSNYPGLSIVPYLRDKYLITAASLNGGNVISQFVSFISSTLSPFMGSQESRDQIYDVIEASAANYNASSNKTSIGFKPTLFGERFDPYLNASICNINSSNFNLESLSYGLYRGLIENVCSMLPREVLIQFNVDTIVCTGGVLNRSYTMQKIAEEVFGMKMRYVEQADASYGAALIVKDSSIDVEQEDYFD